MVTRIDKNQLSSMTDQSVILDTNVWLYVFSPYNENDFGYSSIYEILLEHGFRILLPSIVATEFVNRYCRLSFFSYQESNPHHKSYKKDFRPTMSYQLAYKDVISMLTEEILPKTSYIEIAEEDLTNSLSSPKVLDLNDDVIANIAQRTNSILISHDGDYLKINKNIKLLKL